MAKKILIVADADSFIRKMFRDILSRGGYTIAGDAAGGTSGIELLSSKDMVRPDAAVINYEMSDLDGLSVAGRMLQIRPSLAIVLCVSADHPDARRIQEDARALGVRCVLRKRFTPEDLRNAVEAALKRSLFSAPKFYTFGEPIPANPRPVKQENAPTIPRPAAETSHSGSGNRILIAESAPFMRMMLEKSLTDYGYEIIAVPETNEECLRILREQKPDLVIVTQDASEKGPGGTGLITQIRQIDPSVRMLLKAKKENVPDPEAFREKATDLGANGILLTPFTVPELVCAVDMQIRYQDGNEPPVNRSQKIPDRKIVIIESSRIMQESVAKALEGYGYEIVGRASDGRQGLLLCQEKKPDLAIVRYETPAGEPDGIALIREIRQLAPSPLTLICIDKEETADASDVWEKAKQAGASLGFIYPGSPRHLLLTVDTLLRHR